MSLTAFTDAPRERPGGFMIQQDQPFVVSFRIIFPVSLANHEKEIAPGLALRNATHRAPWELARARGIAAESRKGHL